MWPSPAQVRSNGEPKGRTQPKFDRTERQLRPSAAQIWPNPAISISAERSPDTRTRSRTPPSSPSRSRSSTHVPSWPRRAAACTRRTRFLTRLAPARPSAADTRELSAEGLGAEMGCIQGRRASAPAGFNSERQLGTQCVDYLPRARSGKSCGVTPLRHACPALC